MASDSVSGLQAMAGEAAGSQPLPAHRSWYEAQRQAGMAGMAGMEAAAGGIPPEDMEMFFPSIDGGGNRSRYYGTAHAPSAYPAHSADWTCEYCSQECTHLISTACSTSGGPVSLLLKGYGTSWEGGG